MTFIVLAVAALAGFGSAYWALHGSPPLGLLTRTVEELAAGSALRVGRLTLDILGAIPVAPVTVRGWVSRPGSRIAMMTAEMLAGPEGSARAVARVTAWLIATNDTRDVATDRYPPLVEGPAVPVPHSWAGATGYLETISWRRQPDQDGSEHCAAGHRLALPACVGDLLEREERCDRLPATFEAVTGYIAERAVARA